MLTVSALSGNVPTGWLLSAQGSETEADEDIVSDAADAKADEGIAGDATDVKADEGIAGDASDAQTSDESASDEGAPDGIVTDQQAGGEDLSDSDGTVADGIIEETEEETEAENPQADPDAEPGKITETAEINDPLDTPDTLVYAQRPAQGGTSGLRVRRALKQTAFSGNSFSTQLGTDAKAIYDSKVSWYAEGKHTGTWTCTFDPSTYTFRAVVTGAVKNETSGEYDLSNAKYDKTDETSAQNAESAKKRMMWDMQSAADAFKHDHPEVFWIRSPKSYSYTTQIVSNTLSEDDQGRLTATFCIVYITYKPVESFTGAGDLIGDYQTGVDSAVAEVKAAADSLNTDGADRSSTEYQALLVRAADQYLSDRLYYDSDSLSTAVANAAKEKAGTDGSEVVCRDECQIYTSAAAFLPEGGVLKHGVVCEGYAKALKVLCDRLSIPAICVAGLADKNKSGSGHMWNAVKIGKAWYLTDPTWDDIGTQDHKESSRKYLLVSNYTNNTLLTSRTASGNFSGSSLTTQFVYPGISETCYETSHNYESTETVEPTCTEEGYTLYTCKCCGYSSKADLTKALGHDCEEKATEPTCTEGGYTLYTCRRCGYSKTDLTKALGHDYEEKVTEPTCTEGGYTLYTCRRCGDSYKGSFTEALGHDYTDQVVKPTETSKGYTLHVCRRCGDSYQDSDTDRLLKKTYLKKVRKYKKGRFKVTFRRTRRYRKYEIQYATKPDFSDARTKTVKLSQKTNTVCVRARRRTTYYVRVRAVSGSRVGAFSRVRKVRTR